MVDEGQVQVAELPGRFVLHDVEGGPYAEVTAAELLDRAWMTHPYRRGKSGIFFLAVAPRGARMGISIVRRMAAEYALSEDPATWANYVRHRIGITHADAAPQLADARLVTRLLRTQQVLHRYFARRGTPRSPVHPKAQTAIKSTGASDGQYWWCVEVRAPLRMPAKAAPQKDAPPAFVYLWWITDEPGAACRAEIRHLDGRRASLVTQAGQVNYEFRTGRA
jgi:hypothetical protein